jgi:glycerol-3-phosphate dehydrogenase
MLMNRQTFIDELRKKSDVNRDVIVIGGGATGMGIALDAATRGFSTILFEQSDFAGGTSSRSTKLVHGGVRYMAQGDLFLVMEALHERGLMLKNARHLTSNQEFVIPVYTLWDKILYTVGLKFYDLLAGRLSLGKSYFIDREETLKRIPQLISKGLKGGIVYHDGQFDDSRMVISLASACVEKGALVLNYFRVTGFMKDEAGKINGVVATEITSGEEFRIRGRVVMNATGVFADELHRMDNPCSRPTIKPSQGVHLVLDRSFINGSSAIMIPKTDDGRVLFAIPWYGRIVIGTTDTALDKIGREPKALESEIDFILSTAEKYLVRPPRREDILCVFAGLRPLAADPDNPSSTREVSRRHKITLSSSGLLTVIGGKWTTYRRMAEETIDRAIKAGLLEKRKCVTKDLRIFDPDQNAASGRLRIYGNQCSEIERMIDNNPELGMAMDPDLPYTRAEMIWICRNEMPLNLDDLLARRTRALFLNARVSTAIAADAAGIMADELDHDANWVENQVTAYRNLAENYI